jgi:antitoxin VapB
MTTAKLFANGQSQAVRLPKEYRFDGDEVFIKKIGNAVVLIPKGKEWDMFISGLVGFSDDFMSDWQTTEAALEEREAF